MNIMLHEKRFLATLIDAGIGLISSFVLSLLFNILLDIRLANFDYYYLIMFTITMFLYQFFCVLLFKNQTVGLYLMSLKLLSNDWERVSVKQNILRSISISVPVLFIINLLYMVIYKTKSTTLFDDISDTMVVNTGENYHVNPKTMIDKINDKIDNKRN